MSIDSSSTDDDDSEQSNEDLSQISWLPRDLLRRTNWLYRVDALRIHDMREMYQLWDICNLFERYATMFIAWAYSIKAIMSTSTDNIVTSKLNNIFIIITKLIEMFWSEGYCYFLDFLRIAYYPVTNRFNSSNSGPRFATVTRLKISMLGHNKAKELTGFSMNQLELLYKHLRFPDKISEPNRYRFGGEEAL